MSFRIECKVCSGRGYVQESTAKLYLSGMRCFCGGEVVVFGGDLK